MSFRSLVGGLFVMLGCATAMVSAAGMTISMQMQTGTGLMIGLAALGAGAVLLLVGMAVLLVRA